MDKLANGCFSTNLMKHKTNPGLSLMLGKVYAYVAFTVHVLFLFFCAVMSLSPLMGTHAPGINQEEHL